MKALKYMVVAALVAGGCVERDLAVPTADEVGARYEYRGEMSVEMTGNVATLRVTQPTQQVRRGGTIWVKVGPYVLLFSEQTRGLMEDFPGLAGVRVVTQLPGGTEVARALLMRDALTDVRWRSALNVAGRARRDGTEQPRLLENLVQWGEDHCAEFEYNPRYTNR